MASSEEAAQAAGEAAYERAEDSSWPPTEEDYAAIGAVAGTAACVALGAAPLSPICGAIGGAVGGAIYALGDAIAHGLDANRQDWDLIRKIDRVSRGLPTEYAKRLSEECDTSVKEEIKALQRWNARIDDNGIALDRRAWLGYGTNLSAINAGLAKFQKQLFVSASARSAECKTLEETSSSTVTTLVLGGAAVGGVLWLLVKLL